jgi:hypothetical protein
MVEVRCIEVAAVARLTPKTAASATSPTAPSTSGSVHLFICHSFGGVDVAARDRVPGHVETP